MYLIYVFILFELCLLFLNSCIYLIHVFIICDRIWENQPVSEENKFLFYCFVAFYVERRCRRPNLKPIRRIVVE